MDPNQVPQGLDNANNQTVGPVNTAGQQTPNEVINNQISDSQVNSAQTPTQVAQPQPSPSASPVSPPLSTGQVVSTVGSPQYGQPNQPLSTPATQSPLHSQANPVAPSSPNVSPVEASNNIPQGSAANVLPAVGVPGAPGMSNAGNMLPSSGDQTQFSPPGMSNISAGQQPSITPPVPGGIYSSPGINQDQTVAQSNNAAKGRKKTIAIIVAAVAAIVLLAVAAIFLLGSNKGSNNLETDPFSANNSVESGEEPTPPEAEPKEAVTVEKAYELSVVCEGKVASNASSSAPGVKIAVFHRADEAYNWKYSHEGYGESYNPDIDSPGDVGVVVCLDGDKTDVKKIKECSYQKNNQEIKLQLHSMGYSTTAYDAKTGEELNNSQIPPSGADVACPMSVVMREGQSDIFTEPNNETLNNIVKEIKL